MAETDYTTSITAGKPKTYTGGLMIADLGTALPTKETPFGPLDAKFEKAGYVGEDGFTRKPDSKEEDEKAWGGVVVNTLRTDYAVSYEFELLCTGDPAIMARVFGKENVEVIGDTMILHGNAKMAPRQSFVFEMFDKGLGEREVIGNGQIIASDDVKFSHAESKKIKVTVKAYPDVNGDSYLNFKQLPAGGSTVVTP